MSESKEYPEIDVDDSGRTVDPRARPVILAANALKILTEYTTNSSETVRELRRCMDGLRLLQEQRPPLGRRLLADLDIKVQVLEIRFANDPATLDSVRQELTERVVQLGDALMKALMSPLDVEFELAAHLREEDSRSAARIGSGRRKRGA